MTHGLLDVAALRNYHLLRRVRGDLLAKLGGPRRHELLIRSCWPGRSELGGSLEVRLLHARRRRRYQAVPIEVALPGTGLPSP